MKGENIMKKVIRITALLLALLMLAGTVFAVIAYVL